MIPFDLTMFKPAADVRGFKSVTGFKNITPPGVSIVAMVEFRGTLYVATSEGLYRVQGDKLVRIEFAAAADGKVGGGGRLARSGM